MTHSNMMMYGALPYHTVGPKYNPDRGYTACKATAIIAGALGLEEYQYNPDTGVCTGVMNGQGVVTVNPDIRYDTTNGYQWTGLYTVL